MKRLLARAGDPRATALDVEGCDLVDPDKVVVVAARPSSLRINPVTVTPSVATSPPHDGAAETDAEADAPPEVVGLAGAEAPADVEAIAEADTLAGA